MRILVAGAGIAGIGAALALTGPGRTVEILDRDPAPPEGGMNDVFETWNRKGATQLRHSHVFLARLFNLIRDRYPELRDRLIEAGARELRFADGLWPTLKEEYSPAPTDNDMSFLSSRRTTLEAVMRVYAEERSGAIFRTGYKVRGIDVERPNDGPPVAKAFRVETPAGTEETWQADLLIDATGRTTALPDWLKAYGIDPKVEESPAGILYYTRHYRLKPGQSEPDRNRRRSAGGGDFGFIKGGVFPADSGNFSITIALPEIETDLRQVVVDPDVFDAFARILPGLDEWIDPDRAFGTSKVFSMGNLKSMWRHWIEKDEPLILNFFAMGDATIRTNPLYGRGCSMGMLHAHILADVMRATDDPVARAKFFATRVKAEIRPFYDLMVRQDAAAIRRAKNEQDPNYKPRLRARLIKSFAEDAIVPATRGDIKVLRALMRGFHMVDPPNAWIKRPDVLARVLAIWATPKRFKKHLYLDHVQPKRVDLLAMADQMKAKTAA